MKTQPKEGEMAAICAAMLFVFMLVVTCFARKLKKNYIAAIAICAMGLIVLSPIFMEYSIYSNPSKFISQNEYGSIEIYNYGIAPCWNNCAEIEIVSKISSEVMPITENPKVRDLSYTVSVTVADYERLAMFIDFEGKEQMSLPESQKRINRLVKSHLYDFNDAYSRELAHYHNPFDKLQHQDFEFMLREYLDQKLEYVGLAFNKLEEWDVK